MSDDLSFFQDKEYIIYKAYPEYNMVYPLCLVHESFFKSSHVYVCKVGCDSGSHGCSFDLNVVFIAKGKIVRTFSRRHDNVFGDGLFWFVLPNSSSTIVSPSSVSIFVYRLDTSSVAK